MSKCFFCFAEQEIIEKRYHYKIFDHEVVVDYEQLKCPNCGVATLNGKQMEELERKLFRELLKHVERVDEPDINLRYAIEYIILEIVSFGWRYNHKQFHEIFYEIQKQKVVRGIEYLQFRENHVYPICDLADEIYDELRMCKLVQCDGDGVLHAKLNRDKMYTEALDKIYQKNPGVGEDIEKIINGVVNGQQR